MQVPGCAGGDDHRRRAREPTKAFGRGGAVALDEDEVGPVDRLLAAGAVGGAQCGAEIDVAVTDVLEDACGGEARACGRNKAALDAVATDRADLEEPILGLAARE